MTGPTGSGKTTTLYSALNELNSIEDKLITTEDPVEYDMQGIVQIPIDAEIGNTFAHCLRSILRQDPDKILVGEIRDLETAEIAVQASLTGHTVFSTLHTNDAPSTITRMKDMGVPTFLITATVEAILAQRLVHRICTQCREEITPTPEMLQQMGLTPEQIRTMKFYRGAGCDVCNNTGYKGRASPLFLKLQCSTMALLVPLHRFIPSAYVFRKRQFEIRKPSAKSADHPAHTGQSTPGSAMFNPHIPNG